jgi:hypothetical protein
MDCHACCPKLPRRSDRYPSVHQRQSGQSRDHHPSSPVRCFVPSCGPRVRGAFVSGVRGRSGPVVSPCVTTKHHTRRDGGPGSAGVGHAQRAGHRALRPELAPKPNCGARNGGELWCCSPGWSTMTPSCSARQHNDGSVRCSGATDRHADIVTASGIGRCNQQAGCRSPLGTAAGPHQVSAGGYYRVWPAQQKSR